MSDFWALGVWPGGDLEFWFFGEHKFNISFEPYDMCGFNVGTLPQFSCGYLVSVK